MDLNSYLQQERYASKTITRYVLRITNFKTWCTKRSLDVELAQVNDILNYIKHLRKTQQPLTVSRTLQSVKVYYNYLIAIGARGDNPVQDIHIQLGKRKLPIHLLSSDELEDLYYSYETETGQDAYIRATQVRNRIITGFMVYQGLNASSLQQLRIEHLQLAKGKLYVPRTRRSNSRVLELKPWQIMELIQYKDNLHPILLTRTHVDFEKLFPVSKFSAVTTVILKKLKTYNQQVKDANYIRASVISNWLSKYEIRKVQYMAGHKRILSTEFYRQDNLESLQKAIHDFHPLR